MSCDACVRHVTSSLSALDGVIHARADLKSNQAIVEHIPAYADAAALAAARVRVEPLRLRLLLVPWPALDGLGVSTIG